MNYTRLAERQVDELTLFYEINNRAAALRNLRSAIQEAEIRIVSRPDAGLAAPRPYPELWQPGFAWIKAGRYWFRYTLTPPATITAVIFDTSDLPSHVAPPG